MDDAGDDLARGMRDAHETTNLAAQMTSDEIAALNGKDLKDVGSEHYVRGWDYAIEVARKHEAGA